MENNRILIIPPGVNTSEDLLSVPDKSFSGVFASDIFRQKNMIVSVFGKEIPVSGCGDISDGNIFEDVNRYARHFSRGWFNDAGIRNVLEFRGVNLAGQFVIAFSYYFVKVLKALNLSIAIFEHNPEAGYVLIDDGSVWSRVFKKAAFFYGKECEIFASGEGSSAHPVDIKQITSGKMRNGRVVPAINDIMTSGAVQGGVLFSCAFRFAEPLIRRLSSEMPVYYLRPEISLKNYSNILSVKSAKYFIPEQFLSGDDRASCYSWIKNRNNMEDILNSHFTESGFFMYEGLNIWDVVRDDIFFIMKEALFDGAIRVAAFNNMLKKLSPASIVVEEDTCPFNRILIECANRKGIPSVQLLHGLLTNELMSSMISSTRIAVPGHYSEHKLLEWGVPDEKILITGAPQYDGLRERVVSDDITAAFPPGLSRTDRYNIAFISNPSFDEREPYFAGNPLTYENSEKKLKIIADVIKRDKKVHCTIKMHPMDDDIEFVENTVSGLGISANISIVKKCDILQLIAQSDLVLCAGSTSYLEALLLKRPVMIFDDMNDMFWKDLRSEYLDISDMKGSAEKIIGILKDPDQARKRLIAQEHETEWHFSMGNRNSAETFTGAVRDIIKMRGPVC